MTKYKNKMKLVYSGRINKNVLNDYYKIKSVIQYKRKIINYKILYYFSAFSTLGLSLYLSNSLINELKIYNKIIIDNNLIYFSRAINLFMVSNFFIYNKTLEYNKKISLLGYNPKTKIKDLIKLKKELLNDSFEILK